MNTVRYRTIYRKYCKYSTLPTLGLSVQVAEKASRAKYLTNLVLALSIIAYM